jgi:CheY-like chemotaxis protein
MAICLGAETDWGLRMGKTRRYFRAIVIDDMDFCREILTDFLESRGYQVLSYPDVTACPLFPARKSLCPQQASCADFLLLDNLMPYMKGIDFLELQRQGNCLFEIDRKGIFSANWSPEDLARAKLLGCKSFHKPYDFEKLAAWLTDQEQRIPRDRVLVETVDIMGKEPILKEKTI